ncbi:SET domain-containing protein-lysine N-methyltransferase [Myxococcaceae bacterium GXIMD 01537]
MSEGEPLFIHPGVKVRPCEWGFGVFTDTLIPEGATIEECHYLKVPRENVGGPPLTDYVFNLTWGEHEQARPGEWLAVVLGYGMVYNHSHEPNAAYFRGGDRDLFTFYATRDIQPGEQICITYGENWWNTRGQEMP